MTPASMTPARTVERRRVRVTGTVQGVGFRPFVYRTAVALGLAGTVGNDPAGVVVEAEGSPAALDELVAAVSDRPPPLALVEAVTVERLTPTGEAGFRVQESRHEGRAGVPVSADVATCGACLAELADPADRRYRYPFVNCTDCGPRYTIVRDVPYDRPATTMAGFELCDDCRAEYHDPADRRFHAQPVCCPACGPELRLVDAHGLAVDGEPIEAAAARLRAGEIVAVKGLGGYHLAVDATDEAAATRLRAGKHREEKPFAVMVADLAAARALCEIDGEEAALLTGPERPIVLLRRRPGAPVAGAVAPGNRRLGVLLAYTPLHHLLAAALGRPFVLTSANVSDEPIAYRDDDAVARLSGIADAFLLHDRAIHMRVDDSIARVAGRPTLLRRSRGYAPRPVGLPVPLPRPVLAVGAELKSTVSVAEHDRAFLSHHLGDLENYETYRSFVEAIEHLTRLFDVRPEVVAHDLHPEYLSTKHATELDGVALVAVQHHHAHIASCLVDNGVSGPVIGLALDGLGLGTDGTVWGGEVLAADLAGFTRLGHLDPVPLPGGAAAIRQPWRMAAAHLDTAFDGQPPDGLGVRRRNAERWEDVVAVGRSGIGSPATSSAGRLFDAVAAVLGIRDVISYEGQAAIELEQAADVTETGTYPARLLDGDAFRLAGGDLVRAVVEDRRAGAGVPVVAARFHNGVVGLLVAACERAREQTGLAEVALSGGVFQNALLVERTVTRLETAGFRVLTHRRVPPNDGGVSLGQVAVAGARDRSAGATGGSPPAPRRSE